MKRVLFIVIDQLPGHWAEGVTVEGDIPPVNVWGYHKLGLIPTFSHLIESGLFAFCWNRGVCDTAHGMKYLATGTYDCGPFWSPRGGQPYYPREGRDSGPMGLFEFAKHYDPDGICSACFTTDYWAAPGYFFTASDTYAFSAYFPDERMWREFALPYLRKRENWNLVHIYFPLMDSVSFCPSYQKPAPHPRSSKHAYMMFLDSLLSEVVEFLLSSGLWDETLLVLASDHGYHAACSVARKMGATTPNWCCDHPGPYDCEVWDFESDRPKGIYSGGPRRTLLLLSGGALPEGLRGKTVKEAEIIDVAPTIADFLGIPFECQGKSLFLRLREEG